MLPFLQLLRRQDKSEAGAGGPSTTKVSNTPAERLTACKRICNALQHLWRNSGSLSEDETVKLQVAAYIKRLNSILHDESRKTAPHSCLHYVCTTQIFIIVTKLAISASDEAITDTSVHFFHLLINGETENLLDSKIFARSLIDIVRKSRGVGETGEADLVELLFEICTKIRIDPDILPAWFYPERGLSPPNSRADDEFQPPRRSASVARLDQFPLFYVLVDYVHNDGSSGDFARTGLLYLIETTSKSQNLEKWMIESDLAPQMASGLGALYSRLSRAPPAIPQRGMFAPTPPESFPEKRRKARHRVPGEFSDHDSEESEDEEPTETLQSVHAFLSYLAFWQDTLNHCSSIEVADTLLDHFQVLFVQQLLYPSLLESSDMDGGSTAAVVAHLYRILDSLEHRQMLQRILDYLLSSQQRTVASDGTRRRLRVSVSRRKSMDKLAAMVQSSDEPSPDLFNLLDLITLSLKSSRAQTNTAALKLVSIMLRKHHDLVFTTLFKLQPCNTSFQTRETFERDLILLFNAATSIMDTTRIDESYQALLEDVQLMINEHSCDLSFDEEGLPLSSGTPRTFEVSEDCKLAKTMRELFQTFFANDTMTNVSLTETVMCLASCRVVTLRGWLMHKSADSPAASSGSSLIDILTSQVEQIKRWRGHFPKWDELFSVQQNKLLGICTPAALSVPKSPQRSSFDRPISPIGLGLTKASSSPRITLAKPTPASTTIVPGSEADSNPAVSSTDLAALLRTTVDLRPPSTTGNAPPRPTLPDSLPSLAERLSLEPRSGTPISEGYSSSGAATPNFPTEQFNSQESVTLEHVLTNAVVLQEFLLEIAAVVQIRAALFGEVEVV